jgi:glycosyltransferase involved in cell wall biosynthesis
MVHLVDTVELSFPVLALQLARLSGARLAITPATTFSVWEDPEATLEICKAADILYVLTRQEAVDFQARGVRAEAMVVTGQGPELEAGNAHVDWIHEYACQGPLLLFLGRKIRFKGYHLLLQATRLLWQRQPDAHLLFLGPHIDPDCAAIFAAFQDRRILEVRQVSEEEKKAALEACHMLVLPTTADVFPLVFVEAWACGKPVISGRFAGVEDVVRHGRDGLIVEHTVEDLCCAITMLLEDTQMRQALGEAGRQRVREELNWERILAIIEAGYQGLR